MHIGVRTTGNDKKVTAKAMEIGAKGLAILGEKSEVDPEGLEIIGERLVAPEMTKIRT